MEDQKSERTARLFELLRTKSAHKQATYRNTVRVFELLKEVTIGVKSRLEAMVTAKDKSVVIECKDRGAFELEIKFSGDLLIFNMHTNVFTFNETHYVNRLSYIEQNPLRSYCGVIHIYNFLADSYKYNRLNDLGYLIGRIFVNSENHFFVEGIGQLGFLYRDFENQVMSNEILEDIIQTAMIQSVDFDLEAPPLEQVQAITLHQKLATKGNEEIKTGKKVGYGYTNKDRGSIE